MPVDLCELEDEVKDNCNCQEEPMELPLLTSVDSRRTQQWSKVNQKALLTLSPVDTSRLASRLDQEVDFCLLSS